METCNDTIVKFTGSFGCKLLCPCGGSCPGPKKCHSEKYRDRKKLSRSLKEGGG